MSKKWSGAFVLVCLVLACPTIWSAGTDSVVGKWLVHAETPQGPLELAFDLTMDGDRLVGTVTVLESVITASALKFEDPQLTMQINLMGADYKLAGALQDGKLSGNWEQIGGEMKGAWTAERPATPAAPAASAPAKPGTAGIEGTWNSVAITPDGDLAFTLELRLSSTAVEGKITSGSTSVPLKGTFTDNKVSFQVEHSGGLYRLEATLAGDKLTGKWSAVDGTDGGVWSADRGRP